MASNAPAGRPLPPPGPVVPPPAGSSPGTQGTRYYDPNAFGPGPGPQLRAPAVPHPDVVMGLLFMLIIVNGFSSGQFQKVWSTLIGKQGAAKHDFLVLGGEFAFAVGLSMIAQTGAGASKVILTLIIALWILWGMQNVQHIQNFTKKAKP